MFLILDYLYLRVYKLIAKSKLSDPEFTAINLTTIIFCLGLFDIYIALLIQFGSSFKSAFSKFWFAIPYLILLILIKYRYEKKVTIKDLKERWIKESLTRNRLIGLFIILFVLCSIVFIITFSIKTHGV